MSSYMIIGEPGTGKSTSCRNLDPKETVFITPNQKPLPFKGGKSKYSFDKKNLFRCTDFKKLSQYIDSINEKAPHVKYIVVEDLTHYFSARVIQDARKAGYDKWTSMAVDCYNAIIAKEAELRPDLNLIIIGHTQNTLDANGRKKVHLQTPGKMLDQTIKVTSYFTYVLHSTVTENNSKLQYTFLTQTDGIYEAKSPMGCLELNEPNDMAHIIKKVTEYELDEETGTEGDGEPSDEEMKDEVSEMTNFLGDDDGQA